MDWDWNPEKTKQWLKPAEGMDRLARHWKEKGFQTMLDRGCGPGRHALYFSQQGFAVTAMDLSAQALSYLSEWAERKNQKIQIVSGDMFAMPFPDQSFDCILDYNVSYHTDTAGYHRAVAELRRVLRAGGECYLTLLSQNDPAFQNAPADAHIDQFTLNHTGEIPHFYASEQELPSIFTGFTLLSKQEIRVQSADYHSDGIHFHLLLQKDNT